MWLSIDSVNRFKSIYLDGFIDVSGGDIIARNGRLFVANDASFASGMYVSGDTTLNGDVSLNGHLFLADDASFNKNVYVSDRITASAITLDGKDLGTHLTQLDISVNTLETDMTNVKADISSITSVNATKADIQDPNFTGVVSAEGIVVSNDISLNGNFAVGGDISANGNVYLTKHVGINSQLVSGSAVAILQNGEKLSFTVPLYLDALVYYNPYNTIAINDFTVATDSSAIDQIFYITGYSSDRKSVV